MHVRFHYQQFSNVYELYLIGTEKFLDFYTIIISTLQFSFFGKCFGGVGFANAAN